MTPASPVATIPQPTQPSPQGDQSKKQSWSWRTLAVTATLGLTATYLLNRLFPTTPLDSVFRYAVSLAPAGVYMLSGVLPDQSSPEIIKTSFQSSEEKQRQARVGIKEGSKLCKEYMAAWLQHPGTPEFSDEEIESAHRQIKASHSHDYVALVDYLRATGWDTVPVPDSFEVDSLEESFGEPGQAKSFPIHGAWYDAAQGIPLESLGINDVLLCSLTPKEGSVGLAHIVAIQRASETEFTYYDPALVQATTTGEKCKEMLLKSADITGKELCFFSRITTVAKR